MRAVLFFRRTPAAVVMAMALALALAIAYPETVGAAAPSSASLVPSGRLAGLRFHVVARGDTLRMVSARYGVPVAQIRSANGLTRDALYVGARLLLDEPNPGRMTPGATGGVATSGTYTVKAGDNLATIAKRQGTTVAAVVAANHLASANMIRIGQKLTIAGTAAAGPACPVRGARFSYDWGFPRADGARFHEGLDMFAPAGTPIVAMVAGTVSYGSSTTPGRWATLKGTNGWQYYFAHLSKFAFAGRVTKVNAGDVIGFVGTTGDALGGAAHAHVEIRPLDGRPVNPLPIVAPACAK